VQNIPQQDSAERAFNKLARITSQMETLKRYRSEGQRKILVQHTTTVNADKAVVTDSVVTGKNSGAASSAKLIATVADKPMEILEPTQKEAVPVRGGGAKAK
jgi:peptidyl-tRNA hydrolase